MSLLKASGKLLKVFAPKLAWDTYGYLLLLYSKEIWRIGKIKLQHWGFLNNLNTSNWFAIETVPGGRTQSGTILQLPHVPSTSWKRMRNWRYLLRMGWEEWSSLLGLFCFCATQDWRGCWEGNTTLQPIYFAPTYGGWSLSLWVKILSGNKESLEEMRPPGVQARGTELTVWSSFAGWSLIQRFPSLFSKAFYTIPLCYKAVDPGGRRKLAVSFSR